MANFLVHLPSAENKQQCYFNSIHIYVDVQVRPRVYQSHLIRMFVCRFFVVGRVRVGFRRPLGLEWTPAGCPLVGCRLTAKDALRRVS